MGSYVLFLEQQSVKLKEMKLSVLLVFSVSSLLLLGPTTQGKKSNGKSCTKDAQCDSENCCGVWPFKRCRECCNDDDCSAEEYCKGRSCHTLNNLANGESCSNDNMCESANCCGVWPLKRCRECCGDSDCPLDKFCKNRSCVDKLENGSSCVQDDDKCISGNCCGVWPAKKCRECCDDSNCQSDERCRGRKCIKVPTGLPNGSPCKTSNDCQSKNCCPQGYSTAGQLVQAHCCTKLATGLSNTGVGLSGAYGGR